MNWTLAHIEKLKAEGKIVGYKVHGADSNESVKQNKYRNKKITWNGIVFDSKKEFLRYQDLLLMEKLGEITDLRRQVEYLLIEKQKGLRATKYIADHVYIKDGAEIVEDVKSSQTRKLPTYVIKKKLMKERYGITILEK